MTERLRLELHRWAGFWAERPISAFEFSVARPRNGDYSLCDRKGPKREWGVGWWVVEPERETSSPCQLLCVYHKHVRKRAGDVGGRRPPFPMFVCFHFENGLYFDLQPTLPCGLLAGVRFGGGLLISWPHSRPQARDGHQSL